MSFWTEFIAYSLGGLPPGLISIIIISLLITFFQVLVFKVLSDQGRIKEIKEKQKTISDELKKTNDIKRIKELNNELVKLSMENMRLSIKPLLIILLPLIFIFWFLKKSYDAAGVGNIISWGANLPIVGDGAGWLLSFIIFTSIFNIVLRKVLKIQ
ncbi:MAG: hypothetical protein QW244_02560 [Candidatus Pacearchaeota archaeon]